MARTNNLEENRIILNKLWALKLVPGTTLSYKVSRTSKAVRRDLAVRRVFRMPPGHYEVACEDDHGVPHYVLEEDIVSIYVPDSIFKKDNPNAAFARSK